MPELSKPLIAVIGVLVSIAILFIAVLGILPFLQGTISGVSQQAQFSAVASASTTVSGGTINNIIFTVTVQKLAGTGTYMLVDDDGQQGDPAFSVTVYDPTGKTAGQNTFDVKVSFDTDDNVLENITFTTSATFTINVTPTQNYVLETGSWVIVLVIYDTDGNAVQSLSVSVQVT